MAINKQVLLLISIFIILTSSTSRTLRFKDYPFTESTAGYVHNDDAKEKSMMGIKAFTASHDGYLPNHALVPPSEPSHRRNWKMRANVSEADAGLAEVAGGH